MKNEKKFAFVLGKITPQKESEAVEKLWKLEPVDEVRRTIGKFDFCCKIHFENFADFFDAYLQVKHVPDITTNKVLIATAVSPIQ